MNIGLIAMSGVRIHSPKLLELGVTLPGFVKRGEVIAQLPSLGLLTLAGLTPSHHEVSYLEVEQANQLRELPRFDLVGISSLTAKIDQAYLLADRYRNLGIPVVMGGLHVSVLPEEALQHSDAIVVGGAEGAWPKLLNDLQAHGKIERVYYGARKKVFSPELYSFPRFDLLQGREYNRVTVQTSRGCPRDCDFCAASLLISDNFNQKPVTKIIEEIQEAKKYFPEPFFEFADDNTFLNKKWAREFLPQLAQEEIRYFTETDASVADDPELCDWIARSGCRAVLIGFESPNAKDLQGIDVKNWKSSQAPRIRKVVDTLQSRGIGVIGCFILGLDNQTPEIFPQLLEFVQNSGMEDVQYTVLTPFPGTPLYQKLKQENRLLKPEFWPSCTLFDVNYHPKMMSKAELEQGMMWLFERTYTKEQQQMRRQAFQASRHSHFSALE